MMVTHDEIVACQGVERIHQLFRLRDREVSRVCHPGLLSLEQSLPRGFRQKCEGLREHERKRCGQKTVEHPDHRR